jgi:hypothetical protein
MGRRILLRNEVGDPRESLKEKNQKIDKQRKINKLLNLKANSEFRKCFIGRDEKDGGIN